MKQDKYFIASSVRLMRFLYSLGFDKTSFINKNHIENWKFKHSEKLQEALDFYFYMRKELKGVNENEKQSKKKTRSQCNIS